MSTKGGTGIFGEEQGRSLGGNANDINALAALHGPPRVRFSVEARRKLWPRREPDMPVNPRVHLPGLLAELAELSRRWLEAPGATALHSKDMEPFRELRRVLCSAPEDVYGEARAFAERLRIQANLPLRCAFSFAFPNELSWSRADAEACLSPAGPEGPPACARLLFLSLGELDLCLRLLRAFPEPSDRIALSTYSIEFVRSLGAGAYDIIASIYDEAMEIGDTRAPVRRCLQAMELIRSPAAATFFARRLQYNEIRVFAVRYFHAEPALSLLALPPVASGRGKAAEAAKTILLAVLAEQQAGAFVSIDALSEPSRKVVRTLLEKSGLPAEEAPPASLPQVLVKPPWRHKGARRLRVIENVPVLDARLKMDSKSHDAWANKINWVPNSLVFSPRVALAVVHAWMHRPEAREAADEWLRAFPGLAISGLIPAAVGKPGSARTDAGRMLRLLLLRGHGALIHEATQEYSSSVASIVEDVLGMDPLWDCPESAPKLGEFIRMDALPRPRMARPPHAALPVKAISYLCEMLAFSTEDFPYAGIAQVRGLCDPASLSRFACAILFAWQAAGALLRIAWPLNAIAELGGDAGARALAAMVRSFLYEGEKERAARGMDTLSRMGTDVALMHLSSIAERSRYADMKERAAKKIAEVAHKRGLSAEELGDRTVPELDLPADLTRVLDYGSRLFRVGFDAHLEPYVREETGAQAELLALPRPLRADDPKKAEEAQQTWKALREDMAALVKSQSARLEDAMVVRRRFSGDTFQSVFVGHRLLVHLARRLVWGTYDKDGILHSTFRICEDRTFADEKDEMLELDLNANIGIPHPIEMDEALRRAWGALLSDYEIVQPFAQLGREVFRLDAPERSLHELTRFAATLIPTGRLFGLEYKGYRREYAYDGGPVIAYRRAIAKTPWYARILFMPGMIPSEAASAPPQTLSALELFRADHLFPRPVFGELDPIALSELLRDVDALTRAA